jgi:hypothetical protein
MEAVVGEDDWWTTTPRALDPQQPLQDPPERGAAIGGWLHEPSFTDRTQGASP